MLIQIITEKESKQKQRYIQIQLDIAEIVIKAIKMLTKDIISKLYTSNGLKQRKIARCCKVACYRYAHCTYVRTQQQQEEKMPTSAWASKAKGLKTGTIKYLRYMHKIELGSLDIIYGKYSNCLLYTSPSPRD